MSQKLSHGSVVAGTRPSPDSGSSRISIPKLNRDPIQSLSPYSILLTVAGHGMEIPPLPAVEWLSILMVENPELDDIFPGLLTSDDMDLVEDLIVSRELGLDECEDIILSIIETVSARPWWVTIKLIETARVSWDLIGGELALRGIDPTHISLSSWLDALLLTVIKNMDPKEVTMWCLKLEAPPPDVKVDEAELEMDPSQFMAMAG